MKIDIVKLIINKVSAINISSYVSIPKTYLVNSLIDDLENIKFEGKISFDEENILKLKGIISGKMFLKDDITLEPVKISFKSEVEEIIDNIQNEIDITDLLWQNIITEVPSKVRKNNDELILNGNGWRVISEEEYKKEINKNNNPFYKLNELLNDKEEK